MNKCTFCGKEKDPATKTILVLAPNNISICNHCVSKATLLIKDEGYEDDPIINIKSPLSNEIA